MRHKICVESVVDILNIDPKKENHDGIMDRFV